MYMYTAPSLGRGSRSVRDRLQFIIDGLQWGKMLPWSIEAFITSRNGASKAAHAKFLDTYSITAEDVPLLTMAPSADEPFVDGEAYASRGDPTRLKISFGR